MAEEIAKQLAYEYKANSNLVLQADRSLTTRRDHEHTGEVESLAGKINFKEMGSRATRNKPKDLAERAEKEKQRGDKRKDKELADKARFSSVLSASDTFEGLSYRPKSRETKATYELILSFIQQHIGEEPHDVLRAAADEVIVVLKTETLKDVDKKREIEKLLGTQVASERFAQLVNLGKKITDFTSDSAADKPAQGDTLDDDVGVAVVFEDESEEEEEEPFELRDEDDDGEGGEEAVTDLVLGKGGDEDEENGDGDVPGGPSSASRSSSAQLSVKDIDAFWLQRKVAEYFTDAVTSQAKAKAVMDILAQAKDDRDCENKLVLLLDYDKFDLVKLITKNRLAIRHCTLLGQAQTAEEREKIEAEMRENPLLQPILKALSKERGGDRHWQEEGGRCRHRETRGRGDGG